MKSAVITEIWNRADIIEFCYTHTPVGIQAMWHDLAKEIEAMPIDTKVSFSDNLKYGDIQITLYRRDSNAYMLYLTKDCK